MGSPFATYDEIRNILKKEQRTVNFEINDEQLRPIIERLVKPMLDRKDVALASFEKVAASLSARLDKIEGPFGRSDDGGVVGMIDGRLDRMDDRIGEIERIMATRATRKPRKVKAAAAAKRSRRKPKLTGSAKRARR